MGKKNKFRHPHLQWSVMLDSGQNNPKCKECKHATTNVAAALVKVSDEEEVLIKFWIFLESLELHSSINWEDRCWNINLLSTKVPLNTTGLNLQDRFLVAYFATDFNWTLEYHNVLSRNRTMEWIVNVELAFIPHLHSFHFFRCFRHNTSWYSTIHSLKSVAKFCNA